jgi:hypothetical protein
MRAQFFLFSFGVPSANEFLDFFSHSMLLIWESALLASCYKLSIVSLAKSPCYPRRPECTRWDRADDQQHCGGLALISAGVFLFGLSDKG